MGYRTLQECLADLEANGQLIRINQNVDPHLEAAAIQRKVYQAGGPAIYFARVKNCRFPLVCNLFGTMDRVRYLFRDSLEAVAHLVQMKVNPAVFKRHPLRYFGLGWKSLNLLPRKCSWGPVLANQITVDQLPQLKSWPKDGGAFITLGQVYTENPDQRGVRNSNLGLYRVQMSGGQYHQNTEVGLHYQIHRGIGVHHTSAILRSESLPVNIFIGGPPSMALSAVMPLPEDLPEIAFAGLLGGRRVRLIHRHGHLPIAAEADFCITGWIDPEVKKPEGPFGDHLGYYSLAHDFPVMRVDRVYHRSDAIWPFTTVGRPPQEDTQFGQLIHELVGPVIPTVVPGIHEVHAVDATGVHPLMLAIGSERYTPYEILRRPQELLTQANGLLGQGQMSLAKYLLIVAKNDNPHLATHDIPAFFRHLLERVNWEQDLHFQTRTTIDTLDYSGDSINKGSKVVMAAIGPPRRKLPGELQGDLRLPSGFFQPRCCLPGILAVQGPPYHPGSEGTDDVVEKFCRSFSLQDAINQFPLTVIVDDSEFTSRTLNNFLWVTFTRSNPAADISGIDSFFHQKHWGCRGSLVIDARTKPHHAPVLEENPEVIKRVEALGASGGPLHGII